MAGTNSRGVFPLRESKLLVTDAMKTLFQFLTVYALQGRIAFGNRLLETTLCFKFESATGIYTTSQV